MTSASSEHPPRRTSLRVAASLAGVLVVVAGLAAVVFFLVLGDGESEAERVARASDAVNSAMEDGDFESLHLMLAGEVGESSSPADVRARFEDAAAALGTIVSVDRIAEPLVDAGTAIVEIEVTYDMAGQTSTKAFYDLFVLENGEWRLVYSQPKEDVEPIGTPEAAER